MPRMRILSPSEQEAFDRPPLFDHRERKKFFEFPKALLEAAQSMHSPDHRAGFLVSCGYFKATRRFYALTDDQQTEDVLLAPLRQPAQPVLAARRVLLRHAAEPGREVAASPEATHVGRESLDRQRRHAFHARHGPETPRLDRTRGPTSKSRRAL